MWFAKKSSTTNALLIDIGSGSIGASIISYEKGIVPTVLFSTRERFDSEHRTKPDELIAGVKKTLQTVLAKAQKGAEKIHDVHCFYSSPWQSARTKIVSVNKDEPFEITEKVLDVIVKREEKLFTDEKNAEAQGDQTQSQFKDLRLLDHRIISVNINGYQTNNPYGHKTKEFHATLALTVAPELLIESIESIIQSVIGHPRITHRSFELAAFVALRNTHAIPDDCALVHVHHLVTDLVIVNKGAPLETVSFPRGFTSIARDAAAFLHIDEDLAYSKIKMYAEGKSDETDTAIVKASLIGPTKSWREPIEQYLFRTAEGTVIPKKIYLIAESTLCEVVKEALTTNEFSKFAFSGEPFNVTRITVEESWAPKYETGVLHDANLSLEAIYLASV